MYPAHLFKGRSFRAFWITLHLVTLFSLSRLIDFAPGRRRVAKLKHLSQEKHLVVVSLNLPTSHMALIQPGNADSH